ncbi:MAG: cobalamin-dependent protein [Planctomyces sp.]|nr:cobalamin-dependent protein [Planctomyces sp.]
MPHVSFVALSGFRIHDPVLRELGMTLPGFDERAQALAALPALGLITLAGLLPEHWTCSYVAPAAVTPELLDAIQQQRPDLVAISALTASIEEAYQLSDALRAAGRTTVLGGLHVTACPEEAARHASSIVVGPAEPVWTQLLEDVQGNRLQLRYGEARRPESEDRGDWPLPRFDLLGEVQRYTLQTQRGCPLACDFCAASRLLERFREKPAANIARELEAIQACCPDPLIELADDNTFAGSRDPFELLDVLEASGARWFTESDWRLGERPQVLARLGGAGCVQVLMGIESMVFRYPGMGGKQAELERMLDAVHAIQGAGVAVNGCFIVGADGETPASLQRLTAFLLESPFADVQITLQTPFPGTALRERLARQNRLLPELGWPHCSLFEVTYQPDLLSVPELEQGFREVLTHVFAAASTQRRRSLRRDVWRRNRRLRRVPVA